MQGPQSNFFLLASLSDIKKYLNIQINDCDISSEGLILLFETIYVYKWSLLNKILEQKNKNLSLQRLKY